MKGLIVTQSEQEMVKIIRLFNIVDMGLTFSAMIRLYEKGSKKIIREKIIQILPDIANAALLKNFQNTHDAFCAWGINNLFLADRNILVILAPTSFFRWSFF